MTETTRQHRIVVGVDGSPSAADALRWALGQAELSGATVEAVYVWYIPMAYGWVPAYDGDEVAKAGEQVLAEALNEATGTHTGVPVEQRVIEGNPAGVLIDVSRGADLLVLGFRGHGGFVEALLGSVSQHCVQHANCPVVVIRGEHH